MVRAAMSVFEKCISTKSNLYEFYISIQKEVCPLMTPYFIYWEGSGRSMVGLRLGVAKPPFTFAYYMKITKTFEGVLSRSPGPT